MAPIQEMLRGNYADPSIIRVGSDYYMTHSSYGYVPGLLIWHSRDLVHWEVVSAALMKHAGNVWAPDLVHHAGRYYIYYPADGSNWVVHADSALGPWSEPVHLPVKGIDPGHVVDRDGARYLYMSSGDWVRLSEDGLSVCSEPVHAYDGWEYPSHWIVECFGLESSKLTYREGWYYLTAAEGGTAGPPTSHMIVSSRSRSPLGPWEHSPYNPIVRTASKDEYWWSRGHGTLFDTPDGEWNIAYHGYEREMTTLGRHSLRERIEWTEDGWFRVAEGNGDPVARCRGRCEQQFEDRFESKTLDLRWQGYGAAPEELCRLEAGALVLEGFDAGSSSPLLYMSAHPAYEAEIELEVEGEAEGRLLLYYDASAYMGIALSMEGVRYVRPFKRYGAVAQQEDVRYLRIRNNRHIVSFYYSVDGQHWTAYDKVAEASGFHHNTFGGFLSLRIGLDAVGEGLVRCRRFTYRMLL